MPQVRKSRILAAFYSFLVWGLGELYSGVSNLKIGIGILLIISWLIYLFGTVLLKIPLYISLFIYILISVLSAADAYNDANVFNLKIRMEESNRKAYRVCPNCGERIAEDSKYCPNCGYKLVD